MNPVIDVDQLDSSCSAKKPTTPCRPHPSTLRQPCTPFRPHVISALAHIPISLHSLAHTQQPISPSRTPSITPFCPHFQFPSCPFPPQSLPSFPDFPIPFLPLLSNSLPSFPPVHSLPSTSRPQSSFNHAHSQRSFQTKQEPKHRRCFWEKLESTFFTTSIISFYINRWMDGWIDR